MRDVTLVGLSGGALSPTDAIGARVGIAWDGVATTPTDAPGVPVGKQEHNAQGVISGCRISDFDGAGILLANTGTPVDRGVMISDCFIHRNTVGIHIPQDSEFNKVDNCTLTFNRWGVLNRGGNNTFSNCGIDKNFVGVQIDNDAGSNGGHGSITGCTINHSGADNDGLGLIIRGTGRELVSNCNFYYSSILISGSSGNIISGCGFGSSANIEIVGNSCSLISGCMMRSSANTVAMAASAKSKVVNCFTRDGEAVVPATV